MIERLSETDTPDPTHAVTATLSDELLRELQTVAPWTPRADRRNSGRKFAAGLRGLKYAIRGDSSFFAHGYRGILIAITAILLRVDALGWCLLVISASMVLLAELTHSAVDALARAIG
ncbi:MAG: diacylglycerol kinase, partial [Isosphaeraceae bacterium]